MRAETIEKKIFRYTNLERRHSGVRELQPHAGLIRAARGHSRWMAKSGNYSHVGKDRTEHERRINAAGYPFGSVGENIHKIPVKNSKGKKRSSDELARMAVIAWMESDGHWENIVNDVYKHLGVGVALDGNHAYFTQNFGGGYPIGAPLIKPGGNRNKAKKRSSKSSKRIKSTADQAMWRPLWRKSRRLAKKVSGKIWRRRKRILRRSGYALAAVYVGLALLHLFSGFGFVDALRGPIEDVRITASCFGEWEAIKSFVTREANLGADVLGRIPSSVLCP